MKKRGRGKRHRVNGVCEIPTRKSRVLQERAKRHEKRQEEFFDQWQYLYDQCADTGSRVRLVSLREQFERQKRGVSEPAQVETEIALFMNRAGFSVAFLEESESRTADLECYFGSDRLFVEVTAIVPNPIARREGVVVWTQEADEELEDDHFHQDALVRRLQARMAEKAKQLSRYCAPVVLAITVPYLEWLDEARYVHEKIDLQRVAGTISTVLVSNPQLSAVFLTCWNIPATLARSNIRLSNAYWVARSEADVLLPRSRLLVINTLAAYPLGNKEVCALKSRL